MKIEEQSSSTDSSSSDDENYTSQVNQSPMDDSSDDENFPSQSSSLPMDPPGPPPPVHQTITVSADTLVKVGEVKSIVDSLVIIEAMKAMPPLDLDTVLFKFNGESIGQIYDVFGPVANPHYSIRFSHRDRIKEKDIHEEMKVYFVPQTDRTLTKFVFVNELQKVKGSDASWQNDMEPPESLLEYSDDEEEAIIRRERRAARKEKQSSE